MDSVKPDILLPEGKIKYVHKINISGVRLTYVLIPVDHLLAF